jgi:protein-tyrosine sulfotransferase
MTDLRDCPIFIVGPGRCGSTLMRFILDSHPRIACPPEWGFMHGVTDLLWPLNAELKSGVITDETRATWKKRYDLATEPEELLRRCRGLMESFYGDYARRAGKQRWADKSHPLSDKFVFELDMLFEKRCKFLVMQRHGMDALLSAYERWGNKPTSTYQGEAYLDFYVDYWTRITRIHLELLELRPDRCFKVRYEELVAEPQRRMDEIFRFLEEEPIPDVAERAFAVPHARGAGDNKIYDTKGISTASVGRWKKWDPAVYRSAVGKVPDFSAILTQLGYETPAL